MKKAGFRMRDKLLFRPDALDWYKSNCRMSDYIIRTFVKISKENHNIVFGQSITKMKADKVGRRLDMKFTKETVVQIDGTEHLLYVYRAENLLDVVAHRVSVLINSGIFKDQGVGSAEFVVPHGSVLVSVVVCIILLFLFYVKILLTHTTHTHQTPSTTTAENKTKWPFR